MPFQPGILFSVLLLVLCLGINLTYYPKVRGMFHESGKDVTAVSFEPPALKEPKNNSTELPPFPKSQVEKEIPLQSSLQSSAPAITVKTSKVNKPIQPDPLPKQPQEKEKNSQTLGKKSDTFPIESNPDKPKANLNETQKNEIKSKQSTPKQTEPKQTNLKQLEPKQTNLKQLESKQTEPKQTNLKQSEPKQSEPKQTNLKQLEPKQPESKQPEFSAPTVLPLPSSQTTDSLWDEIKSPATSEPLPKIPQEIVPKIPKNENTIQKKPAGNSETAFLPIVPPSLEKEYWESDGQNKNQLAIFSSQKSIPELNVPALKPSEPTPAYANAYQKPEQVVLPLPDKTNPVEKNKPKPPTFIWETIDSALERPLMYENP
ncbi:MAG: hypothetical protein LBP87_12670 [Planctomycetaceae bacterium]|jgi:hypothetical protein|nr:hypothetical protein [Planctomycetaceae bacterium]